MWFFMALLFQANIAHSLRLEHSVDGGKSFILIGDVDMDPVRTIVARSWPDCDFDSGIYSDFHSV